MLEHVVCGETKVDAVDLHVAMKTLRTVDQNTGQTALEKQFQVMTRFHCHININRQSIHKYHYYVCRFCRKSLRVHLKWIGMWQQKIVT